MAMRLKPPERKKESETNGDSMEVDAQTESKPGSPLPDLVDGDGDVSMGGRFDSGTHTKRGHKRRRPDFPRQGR